MGELSSDGALAGIRDAGAVRPLLCRVLAERDPQRDRAFALHHFYEETDGPVLRWLGQEVSRSPWVWLYGITRLRNADPVDRITPDATRLEVVGSPSGRGRGAPPLPATASMSVTRPRRWCGVCSTCVRR